jgi:phosphoglycerate dehydrogenase-like enzyme
MTIDVLCLRPEDDFRRADALPPAWVRVVYRDPSSDDVPSLMREARVLLIPAVGPPVPTEWFEGSSVRFVQVTGAGVDRLDRRTLASRGVTVSNVPGGSNAAVAEYAVSTASVLLRQLLWADADIRLGSYVACRARMVAANLSGLDGLLVGIIGLGTLGVAVADAFRVRGCQLCYYDPAPVDGSAATRLGARSVSLAELLGTVDVATLHVPLQPGTRGMIGQPELDRMKPSAILIQASRGGVVDEQALADALRAGRIGGAAVDVFSTEPPPIDNPLLQLQGDAARRLLLTPHIAGVTRQSAAFLLRSAWQKVLNVLETSA